MHTLILQIKAQSKHVSSKTLNDFFEFQTFMIVVLLLLNKLCEVLKMKAIVTFLCLVKFLNNNDMRKRTKSFKHSLGIGTPLSVKIQEDTFFPNNAVVSESQKLLYKELTCMVMQSSNYVKSLPKADLVQLEKKKVFLPTSKAKTIVFDMDETLIHKVDELDESQEADVYLDVPSEDNTKVFNVSFLHIWMKI